MVGVDAPGGLLLGAIVLGFVHGVEPGHGWPVAAAYALDRSNAWAAGLAASLLIGVGHLVSSVAVVLAYFYAIAYFDLTSLDDPVAVGSVEIGGPLGIVAGALLIALGVREYYGGGHGHFREGDHGDSHDHDHVHDHNHDYDHDHGDGHRDGHALQNAHVDDEHSSDVRASNDHPLGASGASRSGWRARLRTVLPFVGNHAHLDEEDAQNEGLLGIAWVAFVLGFAHEEEFEIIALCTGSTHCLELMMAYALSVVVGIVGLTMLLVAGYRHFEERVERIAPYLPVLSATVLVAMGLGFVLGVL